MAAKDLPFFLGFMQHLAAAHHLPAPIENKKGEAARQDRRRPAAIITFLDGLWIMRPSAVHCAALGEALAKLHLAGLDFGRKRRNTLSVDGWRPLFEHCRDRANEVHRNLRDQIEKELASLERDWPRGLPQGVIMPTFFPTTCSSSATRCRG